MDMDIDGQENIKSSITCKNLVKNKNLCSVAKPLISLIRCHSVIPQNLPVNFYDKLIHAWHSFHICIHSLAYILI